VVGCGLDSSGLGYGLVVGCCEHGIEQSDSLKSNGGVSPRIVNLSTRWR